MALLAMSLVVCVLENVDNIIRTYFDMGFSYPLILCLSCYLHVAKYPETLFADTKYLTGKTIIHILEL